MSILFDSYIFEILLVLICLSLFILVFCFKRHGDLIRELQDDFKEQNQELQGLLNSKREQGEELQALREEFDDAMAHILDDPTMEDPEDPNASWGLGTASSAGTGWGNALEADLEDSTYAYQNKPVSSRLKEFQGKGRVLRLAVDKNVQEADDAYDRLTEDLPDNHPDYIANSEHQELLDDVAEMDVELDRRLAIEANQIEYDSQDD